jgi:hypothetical protein
MKNTNLRQEFNQLAEKVIEEAEVFTFNLKDLPELNDFQTNIRTEFNQIFDRLDEKLNSCLYWFEVEENNQCSNLQTLLNESREVLQANSRTVPVKNTNIDTNVMYVGIRRGGQRKRDKLSNISGRIAIHLGYYVKGSTQGLQLVHWAKNIDCKVNLKVVQFNDLPNEYLNSIEKIVAHKLRPMCGIH